MGLTYWYRPCRATNANMVKNSIMHTLIGVSVEKVKTKRVKLEKCKLDYMNQNVAQPMYCLQINTQQNSYTITHQVLLSYYLQQNAILHCKIRYLIVSLWHFISKYKHWHCKPVWDCNNFKHMVTNWVTISSTWSRIG